MVTLVEPTDEAAVVVVTGIQEKDWAADDRLISMQLIPKVKMQMLFMIFFVNEEIMRNYKTKNQKKKKSLTESLTNQTLVTKA
jgi:hypothetical protein